MHCFVSARRACAAWRKQEGRERGGSWAGKMATKACNGCTLRRTKPRKQWDDNVSLRSAVMGEGELVYRMTWGKQLEGMHVAKGSGQCRAEGVLTGVARKQLMGQTGMHQKRSWDTEEYVVCFRGND